MSYKDKCFCKYYMDCSDGYVCPRALTEFVKQEALRLESLIWGYTDKPGCYKKINKTKE